jgi:hypothetical protein
MAGELTRQGAFDPDPLRMEVRSQESEGHVARATGSRMYLFYLIGVTKQRGRKSCFRGGRQFGFVR